MKSTAWWCSISSAISLASSPCTICSRPTWSEHPLSRTDTTQDTMSRQDPLSAEDGANIRLLALDVDGVLTDSQLYFGNDGEELKSFSTLDGQGIKLLQDNGIAVALITARESALVARRAASLGIRHVFQGRHDKLAALQELTAQLKLDLGQVAYVGDDLPDLACI